MMRIALLLLLALAAVPRNPVMFHYPRWSPDGRWLVFTSNMDGDDEVWVVSRDGTQKRKLTDNGVDDSNADWHPDGRRILFARHEGGAVQRYVIDTDGSKEQKYTQQARPPAHLAVEERKSGDGQAVFVSRDGAPGWRISRVRWAEQPSVSPNGLSVVFEQREDPNDVLGSTIAVWDSANDSVRPIARGTDPSWSPDGRSVMFKTPHGADNELVITIADLSNGVVRTVTPGVHPHFSPDGKSIAYMADRMDRADVYIIGVDGRGQTCVTCAWK